MRIKRELAKIRETAIYQAFLNDPLLKVKEANNQLFELYAMRMNLSKAYKLKNQADATRNVPEESQPL